MTTRSELGSLGASRRHDLQVIAVPIGMLVVLFVLSLVATVWPSTF
jgi:hypothetical protein